MAIHSPAACAATIALRRVSLALSPDRLLLDDVSLTLHPGLTGLVGANGAGKSVLARVLAGQLAPDSGAVVREGRLAAVAQEVMPAAGASVAAVAGLAPLLAALQRVEAGRGASADIDLLDGRWRIGADFHAALAAAGLARLHVDDAAGGLSGGELMRVALIGAFLSGADWLVLDEPSNHLDRDGRRWLGAQLQAWRGGALVVSHDRELLGDMDRIVELDAGTLRSYGGNVAFYQAQRDSEAAAAGAALEHARAERKSSLRQLRQQHDDNLARASRNARAGQQANMPAIARGKSKSDAEAHAGREAKRHGAARKALDGALREAAGRVRERAPVALILAQGGASAPRRVLELDAALAPYPAHARPLDLVVSGAMRLAVTGPNGCGKTSLLRMFAGALAPLSGTCRALAPHAWLGQHAGACLAQERSVLDHLAALESALPLSALRSKLALLGLGAAQAAAPLSSLSGGERLKAALACALWRREPARLLLLDEPTNHLDLASVQALEAALQAYRGALAVVSHDARFLANLELTHSLAWSGEGWQLRALD
ncbi:ABC-F family ATP-binding cassette domain-containing protein [Massilia sp. CCM 8693]|uniref:ABC-F family ATP-binding cassette domain-containing protein n=1 Tax=Massilia aquatica TaxID=2609000 RepID=A0ABX0LY87_9BURK|nr:ABC-F family ATP-binding cassette domain-containing protein [Massilia aquatica]